MTVFEMLRLFTNKLKADNDKKYKLNNKSTIETITDTEKYAWSKAAQHAGNDEVHISSEEREALNGVAHAGFAKTEDVVAALEGKLDKNAKAASASNADVLATPRTLTVDGDVQGTSSAFDGSQNSTLTLKRRGCIVGMSGAMVADKPWLRFANLTSSYGNWDEQITFKVTATYGDGSTEVGILTAHVRSNTNAVVQYAEFVWELAINGIIPDNFVLIYNSTSPWVAELWLKCTADYRLYRFEVMAEGSRRARVSNWKLDDCLAGSAGGYASLPSGCTEVKSVRSVIKNDISGNAATATSATQLKGSNYVWSVSNSGSVTLNGETLPSSSRTKFEVSTIFHGASDAKYTHGLYFYIYGSSCLYSNPHCSLGNSDHPWSSVYSLTAVSVTSDKNEKNTILSLDSETSKEIVNKLEIVTYLLNDGESGRRHFGMISQQVEEVINELGIDSKDFAPFIKSPVMEDIYGDEIDEEGNIVLDEEGNPKQVIVSRRETGEYTYMLRYEELYAILWRNVQENNKEIDLLKKDNMELKEKNQYLMDTVETLLDRVAQLESNMNK